jgi:intein/homing endonuclease
MLRLFGIISYILVIAHSESEFELPKTIKPERYIIALSFNEDLRETLYNVSMTIEFNTLERINEIKLHSNGHRNLEAFVFDESFREVAESIEVRNESEHVITIVLSNELEADTAYQMLIIFDEDLQRKPFGLYQSDYESESGDKK